MSLFILCEILSNQYVLITTLNSDLLTLIPPRLFLVPLTSLTTLMYLGLAANQRNHAPLLITPMPRPYQLLAVKKAQLHVENLIKSDQEGTNVQLQRRLEEYHQDYRSVVARCVDVAV